MEKVVQNSKFVGHSTEIIPLRKFDFPDIIFFSVFRGVKMHTCNSWLRGRVLNWEKQKDRSSARTEFLKPA